MAYRALIGNSNRYHGLFQSGSSLRILRIGLVLYVKLTEALSGLPQGYSGAKNACATPISVVDLVIPWDVRNCFLFVQF